MDFLKDEILADCGNLISATFSNPLKNLDNIEFDKIRIKITNKNPLEFSTESYKNTQVFHKLLTQEKIKNFFKNDFLFSYKNVTIETTVKDLEVLKWKDFSNKNVLIKLHLDKSFKTLTFEKELPLGGKIVENLDALLEEYQGSDKELFIIGGKSIYELLVNKADRLYLTRINNEHDGDVYLNCFEIEKYKLISKEEVGVLSFEVYEMK